MRAGVLFLCVSILPLLCGFGNVCTLPLRRCVNRKMMAVAVAQTMVICGSLPLASPPARFEAAVFHFRHLAAVARLRQVSIERLSILRDFGPTVTTGFQPVAVAIASTARTKRGRAYSRREHKIYAFRRFPSGAPQPSATVACARGQNYFQPTRHRQVLRHESCVGRISFIPVSSWSASKPVYQ